MAGDSISGDEKMITHTQVSNAREAIRAERFKLVMY